MWFNRRWIIGGVMIIGLLRGEDPRVLGGGSSSLSEENRVSAATSPREVLRIEVEREPASEPASRSSGEAQGSSSPSSQRAAVEKTPGVRSGPGGEQSFEHRTPSLAKEGPRTPQMPLEPVPDPQHTQAVGIEPASFNGITPGHSTRQKLLSLWGKPKQVQKQGDIEIYLYSIEPFRRVEVALVEEKVSSVIVWLEEAFPASQVAQQLDLSHIQPVFISNELGEILGQGYPERGVIFGFEPVKEPGKTTQKVIQIILEPIGPELFLLRAETYLDSHPSRAQADLEEVLRLAPDHARAHWLRARVLALIGQTAGGLEACQEAVRLDPGNSHYRLTYAQLLAEMGRTEQAKQEAHRAIQLSQRRPHVKAQALCLLGDLASQGPRPEWKQALDYYVEAIKTAEALSSSPHPAVRLAAKNAMVDAHLGAAHAIAWGLFKQKEVAVPKWLERASAFAEEIITNEGGSEGYRLDVACRALAACVGLQGKLDPSSWAEKALQAGQQALQQTEDPFLKDQIAWKLATALYDALQVYQFRGDSSKAFEYGEMARQTLEHCSAQRKQSFAYNYLLGRIYFRLGAIYAVGRQDHSTAVQWYEKAVPLLSLPIPEEGFTELARHGETFVSMGVSYWEVGQREKAMDLTQRGLVLMEQAVRSGLAHRSILAVPYGNLAVMHQAMGRNTQARQFAEMAAQSKTSRR